MKYKLNKFIFSLFLYISLITNLLFVETEMLSASELKNSNLIDKISKDYTKKFCNSIGFGLSKESAMNFSFSENKEIFRKRKGWENLDKDLLAHKISSSVIEGCGYQLDLNGDKDIQEFADYYLSLDQENSWAIEKLIIVKRKIKILVDI